MAKREYKGDPIDMTNLPEEKHLSERDGETIAGTSDDDYHDEKTDAWPSGLDREEFTDLQAEIVEKLCLNPNASNRAIAETTEGSDTSVYNVKHKISAMEKGDAVPFDVPDEPTKTVMAAQPYLDDKDDNGEDEVNTLDNERIKELYRDGYDSGEIADELNADKSRVGNTIGGMISTGVLKKRGSSNKNGESAESQSTELQTDTESNSGSQPVECDNSVLNISIESDTLAVIMENDQIERDIKIDLLESIAS